MPRVPLGEVELEYEVEGEGPDLLLIMGIGAQLVLWPDGFVRALVDRGYRVIRFDNRDVGLSTKLDHHGVPNVLQQMARSFAGLPVDAPYDLSDMARDTAGLLDALGVERAAVVGASMGGMIAQHLALEHPHRVRSLTSIMSSPGGRRNLVGKPSALRELLRPAPRSREEAGQRHVEFFQAVGGSRYPIDEDDVRARGSQSYDRSHHPPGFARQMAAILRSGDRRSALRWLNAPTLVIHGSEDPLIPPRAGRATAKLVPDAELQLIEGMGHHFSSALWDPLAEAIARHDEAGPRQGR